MYKQSTHNSIDARKMCHSIPRKKKSDLYAQWHSGSVLIHVWQEFRIPFELLVCCVVESRCKLRYAMSVTKAFEK